MKKKIESLKSLAIFQENLARTSRIIDSIEANIVAVEALFENIPLSKKKLDEPIPKLLSLDKSEKDYIFELGFIALFANFENFMFSIVSELIHKNTKCIENSEKTIKVSEIISEKSSNRIKDYLIDDISIENSKSISKWADYLNRTFKINTFPEEKFESEIGILNELRNLYLHSGGRTNSLFIKNMKKYFKSKISLGQKVEFIDRKKYYYILLHTLEKLYKHLKSQ